MGIFDNFFNPSTAEPVDYIPNNEREAWIAIMYASMMVDGEVSDQEIDSFTRAIGYKVKFDGYELTNDYIKVKKYQPLVGSKAMIDNSVELVSEDYKATIFSIVAEILLGDGIIKDEEEEILIYLASALKLEDDLCGKIIQVYSIRNYGNLVFNS